MSDLHCGEDEEKDYNTTRVIRTLIEAENPDFLAFSGDMVSGTVIINFLSRIRLGWKNTCMV